jgi:ERCC4-type nuclease
VLFHFTEKEYKSLLSEHFIVLVDTREQNNQHIIDGFERQGIKYKKKSLRTGDYSCVVTAYPEKGITTDWYFTDEVICERKNSIEELAGNFSHSSKDDDRIQRELNRMQPIKHPYILIENSDLHDLISGDYRSKLNPDAFFRTLLTWQKRVDFQLLFVNREDMAKTIYELLLSAVNEHLLR